MEDMKISVVIPYWENSEEIKGILKKCVDSLVGYDELIIVWNEGIGFAKACNKGLELATGDYICVVNDDTELIKGSLRDLPKKGVVSSPVVNGSNRNSPLQGCFFCMPREVYEKVGGFDERFEVGFYEDDDLIKRLEEADVRMVPVDKVHVKHLGGRTTQHVENIEEVSAINKKKFYDKWNKD